jgi:hypothetical protein
LSLHMHLEPQYITSWMRCLPVDSGEIKVRFGSVVAEHVEHELRFGKIEGVVSPGSIYHKYIVDKDAHVVL